MQDKKIILAPAKLNIFLKVLGKRNDGYHEIRSGISFINLFDKIEIKKNAQNNISYIGIFKPKNGSYNDCIIKKVLKFLKIYDKIPLAINVTKNIPVQGGLGSASSNAAAVIIALEEMDLIERKNPDYYAYLGADIPCFLFKKDCIATGMGEKITHFPFPKYFFLLVKPNFNNSTKLMYEKLQIKNNYDHQDLIPENIQIREGDIGNDFNQIAINESEEYKNIFDLLENLDKSIFARMTGTGSCCYAVFEKEEHALKAMIYFQSKFPDIWSIVCENSNINN
jgi:4-diphosphocytidyl-2-C-methyl-D-erythritol kinase